MHSFEYDFFVIGGGSGGVRAARWAAGKGLKVGMAEGARLGGTCVNVGCVPKKLFFHAAEMNEYFHDATGFGWTLHEQPTHHWPSLSQGIDKYLRRLNGIYAAMLERAGVKCYQAWAKFQDEHTIHLSLNDGSTQLVTAQYILLAPGGKAKLPEIEGRRPLTRQQKGDPIHPRNMRPCSLRGS